MNYIKKKEIEFKFRWDNTPFEWFPSFFGYLPSTRHTFGAYWDIGVVWLYCCFTIKRNVQMETRRKF